METVKDILNFCNAAIFYDYKSIGFICEFNQVRKCIINIFYKNNSSYWILVSLSILDDIILKSHGFEIENIHENLHDVREKILYMLSFDKLVNDEQQTIRTILNDDDDQQSSYLLY